MALAKMPDPRLGAVSPGSNSGAQLKELYGDALAKEANASEAWGKLLQAHLDNHSPWSTIMHCADAAGISAAELREHAGATPSTLSRWFSGAVEPSRMLRARLGREISELIASAVERMRKGSP